MSSILRLSLSEWWNTRSFPVLAALIIVAAFLGVMFTPANLDPSLSGPARAQWAYGAAFLLLMFYLPSFASELGASQVARNHRLWRKAMGQRDLSYFAALCLAGVVVAFAIASVMLITIVVGGVADQSIASKIQATVLTIAAFCIPVPLAIGLSQHVSATVSFFIAFGLSLAGLYAPAAAEMIRNGSTVSPREQFVAEMVMAVLPQMRIGDQAERVTFGWPAAPWTDFISAMVYLSLWLAATFLIGYALFRAKKV